MLDTTYKTQELFAPKTLLSRLMDDEELMKQVLDACLPDLTANHNRFVAELESDAFSEAIRTIHTIKGSAQNSDLKSLALLAKEIEEALKEERPEDAWAMREELSRVVGDSVQAVEGYFLNQK